jgi:hypothetical protein
MAGALAESVAVEGQAGRPLAIAWLGDVHRFYVDLDGVIDNVLASREVLHVLTATPTAAATVESQLRAAGLVVASASLDGVGLDQAVARAASLIGARVLVCLGELPENKG